MTSIRVLAQTGTFVPELRQVDQTVLNFMKQWNIPGGSVAISKDGRLVYARGFGFADVDAQESVTPESQFRIASLSKPLTSVALLQLVEQGRLSLDACVFGPEGILNDTIYADIRDVRVGNITVRHLLQHTAGWDRDRQGDPMFDPVHIAREMQVPPPADPSTIIRYMLRQPLDFTPGSHYAYSNLGYSILGRVIEKITGQVYETYVRTSLLNPLGAGSVALGKNLLPDRLPREVKYYEATGDVKVPSVYGQSAQVPWMYGGFNLEAMDAHGGWIASATDLLRFAVAIEGSTRFSALLSPETVTTMTTVPEKTTSRYALGWEVNDRGNWWHTGSLPGTSALLAHTHDGYTWAVLFNRRPNDNGYFQALDQLIWRAIRGIQAWPTHDLFEPEASPLTGTPQPSSNPEMAPVTARIYPNPSTGAFDVEIDDEADERVEVLIHDERGQLVKALNLEKSVGPWKQAIHLNDQPEGIYQVQINTPRGSMQSRVVKTGGMR